jgi:phthiodiolone/phenolphthiodiolone dimycocerosates ketoreductase
LIKAYVLQIPAAAMRARGFEHPLGDDWQGYQDINPAVLPRERIVAMLKKVDVEALLAIVPHGTPQQIARTLKGFVDAGLRVPKILDYGGMAGLKYAARSAQKVREAEDELLRLVNAR